MTNKAVTVEQWVALFEGIGLNEGQMQAWHELFEARHPDGHEGFLEWLGLSESRVAQVRRQSAAQDWS